MKLIIDLFKKAAKGDSFRPNDSPDKYNDKIAQLNSLGSNQYSKLNTATINKIGKTKQQPGAQKGGTITGA